MFTTNNVKLFYFFYCLLLLLIIVGLTMTHVVRGKHSIQTKQLDAVLQKVSHYHTRKYIIFNLYDKKNIIVNIIKIKILSHEF